MMESSALQKSETVRRIPMTQSDVLIDAWRPMDKLPRLEPRSLVPALSLAVPLILWCLSVCLSVVEPTRALCVRLLALLVRGLLVGVWRTPGSWQPPGLSRMLFRVWRWSGSCSWLWTWFRGRFWYARRKRSVHSCVLRGWMAEEEEGVHGRCDGFKVCVLARPT